MNTNTKHIHKFETMKSGIRRCDCGAWRNKVDGEPIVAIEAVDSTPAMPSQDQSSACTHTPGPWSSRYLKDYGFIVENSPSTGIEHGKIADVMARGVGESDANARLIAAAPNLLEACKAALAALRDPNDEDVDRLETILESAISKAQGKA